MLVDLFVAMIQVTVSVAIMQLEVCGWQFLGDNFYWNYAGESLCCNYAVSIFYSALYAWLFLL